MNSWIRFSLVLSAAVFYVACSEVKFDTKPSSDCRDFNENFGDGTCVVSETGFQDFSYSVRMGQVDLLFVTDNSGSMFAEQQEMANRFPNFLGPIRGSDYRLAIVTTDIPSSSNSETNDSNGNGAFWDGKFLEFPKEDELIPGDQVTTVLSNEKDEDDVHEANIKKFKAIIQRDESKNCDDSNFENCASSDERAIFAVNRAMERSENSSFFRSNGHLAIIILSDEDERSTGGESQSSRTNQLRPIALESGDFPETLVQNAALKMGATKTMSVHSIIIQPTDHPNSASDLDIDPNCKAKQDAQGNAYVFGQYGDLYYDLSEPDSDLIAAGNAGRENSGSILLTGSSHSICDNNYTPALEKIATYLKETPIQLPCKPKEGTLEITTQPEIPGLTFELDDQNKVSFSQSVVGTNVDLNFSCPRGA